MASVRFTLHIDEPEFDRQIVGHARRRMARLQRRTATQAKQDVPVKTGNLGRTIGEGDIRTVGPRTVTGSVHATADYALYVHEGTRPHVIRPRNAAVLRFEVGGRTVFARLVRHPGTKARPFLRNAGERVAAEEAAR
ncbi:Gp22 [Mycolicibacterium canariasense]|uniref:Gp22 n=1 Tax=Mycolicibacterium canariasense TaxID=228230 RepID=A0A100WJ20_MYCCR|nr:hypothetical protein [Mycolicibacterium canariasense]ORU97858.1 hypothetical protein AWB94_29330 [Mycolicibacterium canariasense]GAS98799.1 Gp22 [Mycolicibacterium canariasense]